MIFGSIYKPGTYYSPIPDFESVKRRYNSIFVTPGEQPINAIDIDVETMIGLARKHEKFQEYFPQHRTPGFRYFSENIFFGKGDAFSLLLIINEYSPNRIIEVGSGFSSALMLDARDKFYADHRLHLTFIEPYPDRLLSLLSAGDLRGVDLKKTLVQDVPLSLFKELQQGDILFIDSSHVSKVGSDVNFLIFNVLPLLNKGVIVHIHDVFYPFEYPYEWFAQGIAWNEAYLLRAFLMFNDSFKVIFFNSLIGKDKRFGSSYRELGNGGSIYIQKIK
jgi:hypothetical protein